MELTEQQQKVIDYDEGCCVVKACPGSGKTMSVALRIDKLLNTKEFNRTGIAAMSFTNAAADEIKDKLVKHNGEQFSLDHPHFIGTIDKFINTYIFLPFGHLIMGCGKRPEMVGEPYRHWSKGKGERVYVKDKKKGFPVMVNANPHEYFDGTSFTITGELYNLISAQEFHFSFKPDKYYNNDGTVHKKVQDVIDAKWENFREGYANQSDANYLALKILEKYPLIAKAIANKFQYFIIDEAQDTNAIQMKIIEILNDRGAKNIMLIGDRNQSIYEWNMADPELFDKKYNDWNKIELLENWRSSQHICDFSMAFAKTFKRNETSTAVSDVATYAYIPTTTGYAGRTKADLEVVIDHFISECEANGISIDTQKVAVLFRGYKIGNAITGDDKISDQQTLPWKKGAYYVRDIVAGKLLMEKGRINEGYKIIERAYFDALYKPGNENYHCNAALIATYIEAHGFQTHRNQIFNFIKLLPTATGSNLKDWVKNSNDNLKAASLAISLNVDNAKANEVIDKYFDLKSAAPNLPYYFGTIHSVKGKTFDAVLVLVDKKTGGSYNYTTLLNKGADKEQEEELRTIYVGMTRPRKILMLGVPAEDKETWEKKTV